MQRFLALALSTLLLVIAAPAAVVAAPDQAPRLSNPARAPILGATLAGTRIVAVGDYGTVILSDDGRTFRQSPVPTRTPLTSVFFLDAKRGWAAGHDGTIIDTDDGGETWRLLREERGKERALLSIWFEDASHGLAVGQFGLALATTDGGVTWQERHLLEGEAGEMHLLHLFRGPARLLLIAAEAGNVLRSEDAGATWQAIATGNKGSFWTGIALADGGLLVAGLRGHVFRSRPRPLVAESAERHSAVANHRVAGAGWHRSPAGPVRHHADQPRPGAKFHRIDQTRPRQFHQRCRRA